MMHFEIASIVKKKYLSLIESLKFSHFIFVYKIMSGNIYDVLKDRFEKFDCKLKEESSSVADKESFSLEKFPYCDLEIPRSSFNRCAIIVIIARYKQKNYIVLTVRSFALKNYPGEICFPGGKFDNNLDRTFEDTAYREAYEEIGIERKNLETLCQLPPAISPVGHYIVPLIAIVKRDDGSYEDTIDIVNNLKPDKSEVDSIICLPVSYFLDKEKVNDRFTFEEIPFELDRSLERYSEILEKFKNNFIRIYVIFDEDIFVNKSLPSKPLLYGINASVLLFTVLTLEDNDDFKINAEIFGEKIGRNNVKEYLDGIRLVSFLLYKNYMIKKQKSILKPRL